MGLEAECTVRIGRKTWRGTALLESEAVVFRGGEARFHLPFSTLSAVEIDGEDLVVTPREGDAHRFALGAGRAARWARLIKEPKPLFEKLELTSEGKLAVVDIHDDVFLTALRERFGAVAEGRVPQGASAIFFGVETKDALRKVLLLRARMAPDGSLWVVRPKGSAAVSEKDVLGAVRDAQLTDVKVVALSKTHTAHKCVIPVEMRGKPFQRPPIVSLPPPPPNGKTKSKAPPKKSSSKMKAAARAR